MIGVTFSIAFDELDINGCSTAFIVDPEKIVWPLVTCAYKCIVPDQPIRNAVYESEVLHVRGDRAAFLKTLNYDVAIVTGENLRRYIGAIKSEYLIVLGQHQPIPWRRISSKRVKRLVISKYHRAFG